MKKYIAALAVMVTLVTSAFAQTITNYNICDFTWLTPAVCVELTDIKPVVVTSHYLKPGQHFAFSREYFLNVADTNGVSKLEVPEDCGAGLIKNRWYNHIWLLPVDGQVDATYKYRMIGVPLDFPRVYGKIWQLAEGDSMAFVFNKNSVLINTIRNPKPTYKYGKNAYVIICHYSDSCRAVAE